MLTTEGALEEETKKEEDSEQISNAQPIIFQRSNFDQSRQQAIWFGTKIPPRRKLNARSLTSQKQPQDTTTEITLPLCKELLLAIEEMYTETMTPQDKEWEEPTKRQWWRDSVTKSIDINKVAQLMLQLNAGISLPTSLIKREQKVQRLKVQMFKFWPSAVLKEAWTQYNSADGVNLNQLYLSCKILEQTTD